MINDQQMTVPSNWDDLKVFKKDLFQIEKFAYYPASIYGKENQGKKRKSSQIFRYGS